MLEPSDLRRQVVVIGERDAKADGRWPGMEGAVSTATKLSELLDRPIQWTMPPDNAKDTRAWLQAAPALAPERLATLFVDGLATVTINPPPVVNSVTPSGPVISLEEWREWMFKERISSLQRPGYYLDGSTTGAGKSTIDLKVLEQALNAESA